jgi:poly(hydroxyalkanoate) depolymerase family esterase
MVAGWVRPFRVAAALVLVVLAAAPAATAGGSGSDGGRERRTFSGPDGRRHYELFRPAGGGRDRPLVVYLHGCGETAADAARGTRFAELAARERFLVAFPEQDPAANLSRCWNWFRPGDQSRGAGEPALIAGITEQVLAGEAADRRRTFVAGFSAGAAMAVVMGATYPDLYTAVASVAGCEYRGLPCAVLRSALPPETSGRLAYEAMGPRARPVPVFVVQGDADRVVPPANADLVVRQWLETADLAADGRDDGPAPSEPAARTTVSPAGGLRYEDATWDGPDGLPLVEGWLVRGLGHAWPGGSPAGPDTDPAGPDAAAGAWRFFAAHSG